MLFRSGKNAAVGCHFLFHGIFPTQESNLGLLPCRRFCYRLSEKIFTAPLSHASNNWLGPWQDTAMLRQEAAPPLSPGQSLDTTPSSTQNKQRDQCSQPWDITGPSAQAPPHPLSLGQSCSQTQPGASHTGSGHRDISPRHKDRTWR